MINPADERTAPEQRLRPPAMLPPPPGTLEEIDVPEHLLVDIALRNVYLRGTCSIKMLSHLMKIPLELAETLFRRLNEQQYFEVKKMVGDDYIFSLTGLRTSVLQRSAP